MTSWILNVGDEVLSGKIINTNCATISSSFESIGIEVTKVIVIGDDRGNIASSVKEFLASDANILITTGGLGPTHDDFTKEVISEALNLPLEESEIAKRDMFNFFHEEKKDCNIKQIYYPKGAIIIHNHLGTADGFILEVEGKIIISLVGVPFEMEAMLNEYCLEYLKKKGNVKLIHQFQVMGGTESGFENILTSFISKHPFVNLAPYCSVGSIRYQLTSDKKYEKEFNDAISDFKQLMKDKIISEKNEKIEEVITSILQENNYSISFLEQRTAGLLAYSINNSLENKQLFRGGFVIASLNDLNSIISIDNKIVSKAIDYENIVNEFYNFSKSDIVISTFENEEENGCLYFIKKDNEVYRFSKKYKGKKEIANQKVKKDILYQLFLLLKN